MGKSGFDPHLTQEWLLTNGFGGYASSTILEPITRRYHGLLIAALYLSRGRSETRDSDKRPCARLSWLDQYVYVTYINTTPQKLWSTLTVDVEFTKQYWFGVHCQKQWTEGSPWKMVHPTAESSTPARSSRPSRQRDWQFAGSIETGRLRGLPKRFSRPRHRCLVSFDLDR
jgi:hypothetical protein